MATMNIYVVSGRYGTELEETQIFYTEEEAKSYVKNIIAEDLIEEYCDELENDKVDFDDNDAILNWGIKHDYADETTFKNGFSDWHDFQIEEKTVMIN